MDQKRVKQIIDAYGANPERWPEAERTQAIVRLDTDAELQRYLNEAAELDFMLDSSVVSEPSIALETAILASAPQGRRVRKSASGKGLMWRLRPILAVGSALACIALGATSSFAVTQNFIEAEQADAFLAFGYGDELDSDIWTGGEG